MSENRILYYGGLWPTNMGNSFIDIGALYILRASLPNAKIYKASRFSRFYAQHRSHNRIKVLQNEWVPFDVAEHAEVDYVVVSGNVTHTDFIRVEGPTIRSLVKRGTKFIILGGGCSIYTEEEQHAFFDFMKEVKTYAFISRDMATYEAFRDACQYSHPGIDCAFSLSEAFQPIQLSLGEYIICSFDNQAFERTLDLENETIFRTRHYSFGIRERFVKKLENTFVSDLPDDYLSLYAGARAVHSDRVHACVAALAYGKQARLYTKSPRSTLFAEVGAGDILDRLVVVDNALISRKVEEEIAFLTSVLSVT